MATDQSKQISLQREENSTVKIKKFQSLSPGTYWRLTKAEHLKDPERSGEEGKVYLLQNLKFADDKIHSVEVTTHPGEKHRGTRKFLVQDFLNAFQYEPDGMAIREKELKEIEGEIAEQQRVIAQITQNPASALSLLEKDSEALKDFDTTAGLPDLNPSESTVTSIVSSDLKKLQIQAKNQVALANAQANALALRTQQLQKTISKMTPYIAERGLAAKALANEAVAYSEKIESGLMTLQLYTGESVEIHQYAEGKGADPKEPLTLRQRLLYMDEESLINCAEGGADFENLQEFGEKLASDQALLQRILPEQRGVVAIRYRRYEKRYNEQDPFVDHAKNEINKKTFLLVRDGENIFSVHSTLDAMPRLFPTKDETGAPFKGFHGENITIEDIEYADARKKSNDITLHYKRVLILLWGLYDRERIFGAFQIEKELGGPINFLSGDIQKKIFNFVYDDEPGALLGDAMPTFYDWLQQKNSYVQSGSRVACVWQSMITPETSGSCAKYDQWGNIEKRYMPKEKWGTAIVYERKGELFIKTQVSSTQEYFKRKPFQAQIKVMDTGKFFEDFAYICLDNVSPEEIDYFINNREERKNYLSQINLLIAVREILKKEKAEREAFSEAVRKAMVEGGLVHMSTKELNEIVADTLRMWRAANRGADIPKAGDKDYTKHFTNILKQIWWIFDDSAKKMFEEIERTATQGRGVLLRLAITGTGQIVAYVAPSSDEMDNRLVPHCWVHKIVLMPRKTKISEIRSTWTQIEPFDPRERTLVEHEEASHWIAMARQPINYTDIDKAFSICQTGHNLIQTLTDKGLSTDMGNTFIKCLKDFSEKESSKYVRIPNIIIPIRIAKAAWKDNNVPTIEALTFDLESFLYHLTNEESLQQLKEWIKKTYMDSQNKIDDLQQENKLSGLVVNLRLTSQTLKLFNNEGYMIGNTPGTIGKVLEASNAGLSLPQSHRCCQNDDNS